MTYRYGYPYIVEFSYNYVAQALLSDMRNKAAYVSALSLTLGQSTLSFNTFVPRPEKAVIRHDGSKDAKVTATFAIATGTISSGIVRYEIEAGLSASMASGKTLRIASAGGGMIKAYDSNGAVSASGSIDQKQAEALGMRAFASLDLKVDTREIIMPVDTVKLIGRKSGIAIGLAGKSATAPKISGAPGTTYPALQTPDPKVFDTYPGYLTSGSEFGFGVDDDIYEMGLNYVASYVLVDRLDKSGIILTVLSASSSVTGRAWPTSLNARADIRANVTQGHILFLAEGIHRVRLNGVVIPSIVQPGPKLPWELRLAATLTSFQQFDEQGQKWKGEDTRVSGWAAWVAPIQARFTARSEPSELEPLELTRPTGPTDFIFADGTGKAPVWDAADGDMTTAVVQPIPIRRGEKAEIDVTSSGAATGRERVPYLVLAAEVPAGVTTTRLPLGIAAGSTAKMELTNTDTGYRKEDITFHTNDGSKTFSLELYHEDGKYAVASMVPVIAKNFRDHTLAGGPIGSDRGIATFTVAWTSGAPVNLTISRPNPQPEFRLNGPSRFRLTGSQRRQSFTVEFDAGMRRPTDPDLIEEIEIKSPSEASPRIIRLAGRVTRPPIYIPDVLMPIWAMAYEYTQFMNAITEMEKFKKSLEEGPDIPLPPGPGPDPLPPFVTEWAVISAPNLPAGNEFGFRETNGRVATSSIYSGDAGAFGLVDVTGETVGTFMVGEPPEPEAYAEVLLQFWAVREMSRTHRPEPLSGIAWQGDTLIAAAGTSIDALAVGASGQLTDIASEGFLAPIDGIWPADQDLLVQSEGELHLLAALPGEGMDPLGAVATPFPVREACLFKDDHMLALGEDQALVIGLGDTPEIVSHSHLGFAASFIEMLEPSRALLVGANGAGLAWWDGGVLAFEQFYHEPVARVEVFGDSLLFISPSGSGRLIRTGREWPRVAADVDLGERAGIVGVPVEARIARSTSGRMAGLVDDGHGIAIRDVVQRRPLVRLADSVEPPL